MNSDFRSRVEGERPYLLRYASLQLRDSHAAEDVVQETLLAALALTRLPAKTAQAFMMREHLGYETPDICNLGFFERVALRLHLLICDGCSSFSKQAALLRRAMKRLAD